jgi:hypothetical protein
LSDPYTLTVAIVSLLVLSLKELTAFLFIFDDKGNDATISLKNENANQLWWHITIIPACTRLRIVISRSAWATYQDPASTIKPKCLLSNYLPRIF